MSVEQEQTVRAYLMRRVLRWQSLPYDWMDLDFEDLDDLSILDIPDEVHDAYDATRSNPEDRARDEGDYGRHRSPEQEMLDAIKRRRERGLPLVPVFADIDRWPEKDRIAYEDYRRQVLELAAVAA